MVEAFLKYFGSTYEESETYFPCNRTQSQGNRLASFYVEFSVTLKLYLTKIKSLVIFTPQMESTRSLIH